MFFVTASLPSLETKSPITAHRLPDAHCAASLLFTGVCWRSALSFVAGNARAYKVDTESTTISDVSDGGNEEDGCVRRASRWGRVGAVK